MASSCHQFYFLLAWYGAALTLLCFFFVVDWGIGKSR
jgi:hypothetical protein